MSANLYIFSRGSVKALFIASKVSSERLEGFGISKEKKVSDNKNARAEDII